MDEEVTKSYKARELRCGDMIQSPNGDCRTIVEGAKSIKGRAQVKSADGNSVFYDKTKLVKRDTAVTRLNEDGWILIQKKRDNEYDVDEDGNRVYKKRRSSSP